MYKTKDQWKEPLHVHIIRQIPGTARDEDL